MNTGYARAGLCCALLLLASGSLLHARPVKGWSLKQLHEAADVVVIGTVRSSADAPGHEYPNAKDDTWIAVDTAFSVDCVLKGGLRANILTVRHHRYYDKKATIKTLDGPAFVEFRSRLTRKYLIFLRHADDGVFEPLTGQYDPGDSFFALGCCPAASRYTVTARIQEFSRNDGRPVDTRKIMETPAEIRKLTPGKVIFMHRTDIVTGRPIENEVQAGATTARMHYAVKAEDEHGVTLDLAVSVANAVEARGESPGNAVHEVKTRIACPFGENVILGLDGLGGGSANRIRVFTITVSKAGDSDPHPHSFPDDSMHEYGEHAESGTARSARESPWSKPVNGIQARLTMKKADIVNGTQIISAYLTLRNVSDVGNPMKLDWTDNNLSFRVVDEKGNKVSPPSALPYDGGGGFVGELVLPFESSLTFIVSKRGLGIPEGKAALLDLGPRESWIMEETDGRKHFLEATLKIENAKKSEGERYWHGTIEIPKVEIPVKDARP